MRDKTIKIVIAIGVFVGIVAGGIGYMLYSDKPEEVKIYSVIYGIRGDKALVKDGNEIFIETLNDRTREIKELKFAGANFYNDTLIRVLKEGKIGIANLDGDILIQPRYDVIGEPINGFSVSKIGDKHGFISEKGQTVVEAIYDRVSNYTIDGVALGIKGEEYTILDSEGKIIYHTGDKKIIAFRKGRYILENPNLEAYRWGYVQNGKTEDGFEDIRLGRKFFFTKLDGREGAINENGERIIPNVYNSIREIGDAHLFLVKDGENFIYDITKKEYKKIDGTLIGNYFEGLLPVKTANGWNYTNLELEKVFEVESDTVGNFVNERAILQKNEKYYIIDKEGKIISKEYEYIENFKDGTAKIGSEEGFGLLAMNGKELLSPNKDEVFNIEGIILSLKDGKYRIEGILEDDTLSKTNYQNIEFEYIRVMGRYIIIKNSEGYSIKKLAKKLK